MVIMVNRAVPPHRLFTGLSLRHLGRLVEELTVPWQPGARGVAMLRAVEPGRFLDLDTTKIKPTC
ncbi:hypothetical protein ACIPJM_09580 [Streptomyces halstedii]|uniref:hypothetical protein n=1 Tax=Streptomyces halstedii TaxID=1944 RepID=UPI00382CA740